MEMIHNFFKDCYVLKSPFFQDSRGSFFKPYNTSMFKSHNIHSDFKEDFYSISNKDVVRGFHFQMPPFDHEKLVFILKGKILDLALDLRVNSPTYGKIFSYELCADKGEYIFLAKGIAHAFLALENNSIVGYKVSTEYNKESDEGILWNSVDFNWPIKNPIISERDANFQTFKHFKSPF